MEWDSLQLLDDFLIVAELAGVKIQHGTVGVETLSMPHKPPSNLPKGKMAVYVFSDKDRVLKVGKAGRRSQARYTYQHYNPNSASSSLAKSLLMDEDATIRYNINEKNVNAWLKKNTDRVNYILDANLGIRTLTLLEAFIQCRLEPVYEGFVTQR